MDSSSAHPPVHRDPACYTSRHPDTRHPDIRYLRSACCASYHLGPLTASLSHLLPPTLSNSRIGPISHAYLIEIYCLRRPGPQSAVVRPVWRCKSRKAQPACIYSHPLGCHEPVKSSIRARAFLSPTVHVERSFTVTRIAWSRHIALYEDNPGGVSRCTSILSALHWAKHGGATPGSATRPGRLDGQ